MSASVNNLNRGSFGSKMGHLRPMGLVPFSHIVISPNYKIFLPEYDNQELALQPLMKSLYLLYLKHPEGISFYDLVDHENELLDIYISISNIASLKFLRENIRRLTDRRDNSINEKISRIRVAVRKICPAVAADWYSIIGPRGQAKRINLDAQYVIWN